MELMTGRDVYVRHTVVNGKRTVDMHRVWDVGLFMEARLKDCRKANAEAKDGKADIEQITQDQYLMERKPRK